MNKFLEEILDQPEALKRTLRYYTSSAGMASLEKVKKAMSDHQFEQIIFTGMGSSYFTGFAASNLFNGLGIPSFVVNASELLHYNLSLLKKKTLLICFSQSGESFEIRELLERLSSNTVCVGILNIEDSTLALKADIALYSKSGVEEMTSTKTFITTKLVAYILGWYLSGKWDKPRQTQIKKLIYACYKMLEHYPSYIGDVLRFLGDIHAIQIIARGACFASACQSALMFKEANKIAGTGILGGEFRHGPMEMVQEGFQSILFAPMGKTYSQSIKMAEDIARFGGKVLLLTNGDKNFDDANIFPIQIDCDDEYIFSILSVIPVQILIDEYAKVRGYEAGSFSRGAKVTVVE